MNAAGDTLTVQGDRSVAGFESSLKSVSRMEELRARIAGGEQGLEADLFLAELALGKIGYEEAKEKAKSFGKLSGAQKKELAQLMLDAEVKHLIGGVGRDEEKMMKAGKRLEEILAAGKRPSSAVESSLWGFMLRYADKAGKVELYAKAVAFAKKRYADEPRAKAYLERLDARLKELQAGPDA